VVFNVKPSCVELKPSETHHVFLTVLKAAKGIKEHAITFSRFLNTEELVPIFSFHQATVASQNNGWVCGPRQGVGGPFIVYIVVGLVWLDVVCDLQSGIVG
jgi:hypothetical protein